MWEMSLIPLEDVLCACPSYVMPIWAVLLTPLGNNQQKLYNRAHSCVMCVRIFVRCIPMQAAVMPHIRRFTITYWSDDRMKHSTTRTSNIQWIGAFFFSDNQLVWDLLNICIPCIFCIRKMELFSTAKQIKKHDCSYNLAPICQNISENMKVLSDLWDIATKHFFF